MAAIFHRESLSPEQIKAEEALMANYAQRLDLTFPEKLEMAQIAGFDTWEQYTERIDDLKKTNAILFLEIPELRGLSKIDLKNAIETATSQKDMTALFATVDSRLNVCINNAMYKYNSCSANKGKSWLVEFAVVVSRLCVGVLTVAGILLLTDIIYATGGAAAAVAIAEFESFMILGAGACGLMSASIFGIDYAFLTFNQASCKRTYQTETKACYTAYPGLK